MSEDCGVVSDCEELVGEVNHTTECVTDLTQELYFCSISLIIDLNYLFV